MVKVSYNFKDGTDVVEIKESIKVREFLEDVLHINPEEVLVKRNGKIIDDETYIEKDDEIKIFKVVSGG